MSVSSARQQWTSGHTSLSVDGTRDSRAVTVLDSERPALLAASRRAGRRVLVLSLAGGRAAARARYPQVGRTGVEIDHERPGRRPNLDGARPLLVVIFVSQGLAASRAFLDHRRNFEVLEFPALGERTRVGVQVAEVVLVFAERRLSPVCPSGKRDERCLLEDSDVVVGRFLVVEGTVCLRQ